MKNKYTKLALSILVVLLLGGMVFAKYNLSKRLVLSHLLVHKTNLDTLQKLSDLIPLGTKIKVIIDKSDYTLQVFTADTLVKTYPVVFGGNPVDDKLREGDQCTPEGTFHIFSKYPHKSWTKFIWIDYPTADSKKKHNQAKADGKIPKNARIGGEIGIHGVPNGNDFAIDKKINWTLGCISLKNADVDEIYPYFNKKTEIIIQK
jgi:murein L,D-transpeptidase YafK